MAKKKASEVVEKDFFNPYDDIDSALDDIEKSYGLVSSGMDKSERRQSTGLLVLDLIIGKGLTAGWYTLFGGESSCKSTTASTIMSTCVNSNVPIIQYWDYEGSQEPTYLENILFSLGVKVPVEEIFGLRNPQTSKWAVKPRVRYYSESLAEKFFDSMAKLQRYLPDKIKVGDDWFYVYNHTKDNIAQFKGQYDKGYYQQTGKIRIPAENSSPQAILIVDSYPSMLPEGQDVDDPGSAMALQARMFSEQIKRVKGKMRSKRITVVGMNQLREKPMTMFGCLHGDNLILVDGKAYTIADIVNNKIEGTVSSYNEKLKIFEPKRIIGWHHNGYVEKVSDWIWIWTSSDTTSSWFKSETKNHFRVTANHEILTDSGWKEAKDLVVGDKLISANTTTVVESVRPCENSGLTLDKYDISVEDNHNYCVGQTADVSCVVHNSPEYEPGGQALKFFSDARIRLSSRANPHGKGQIDEEQSYDNSGSDKYRYIHAKAIKNKLSTPYLEGMMRVWVEDSHGKARGLDPVWDTWSYLLMTGQIDGKRNKFKIKFKGWEDMKPISWLEFKMLILGTKKEHMAFFQEKSLKPINIRKFCQKQLAEDNGIELYFDHIKRGGNKVEESE